jgi:hypothetical protein
LKYLFSEPNLTCNCGLLANKSGSLTRRISAVKPKPWLVSVTNCCIKHFGCSLCGGTLIDKRHVLTAAHCVKCQLGLGSTERYTNDRKFIRVALKEFDLKTEQDDQLYFSINSVIIHPGKYSTKSHFVRI